jgi:2-polyprenyl-3-methyl-5-hydroxy-6-metoxy-1,4-benzoquinol methylase
MTEHHVDKLETPVCALCAERESTVAYAWEKQPYRVVRCNACGHHYLSPRLTEAAMIQRYSQDDYFGGEQGGYTNYRAQERALRLTFARLLKHLRERDLCGGRLLEVGCGLGYLLDEARTFFPKRHGTDFSPAAVALAASSADMVFLGGLEAIPTENYYECIVTNHVIEHVYSPRAFVEGLMQRLAPGGSVTVATPDMGSWWRRYLGRRWPSFKMPEHIHYFDRAGLTSLLADCGAVEIELTPYPHAFPASLVAAKLGIPLSGRIGDMAWWIPGTTLALTARKPS